MDLIKLGKVLRQRLSLPLPGSDAQYRMANSERRLNKARFKIPDEPRKGAVLILLYEKEDTMRFPLIVRPVYEGVHSGQVSLPGGGFEDEDETLAGTAVRECVEETGLMNDQIELLGRLSELYIPPSNFLITPYVGIHRKLPLFNPHAREVARIAEINIEKLMDENCVSEKLMNLSSGVAVVTPYFDFDGLVVWGATAMILSEFKSVMYEVGVIDDSDNA